MKNEAFLIFKLHLTLPGLLIFIATWLSHLVSTEAQAQPDWIHGLAFSEGELNCFVGMATQSTERPISDRDLENLALERATERLKSFYELHREVRVIPDIQKSHSGYAPDGRWTTWILLAISDETARKIRARSDQLYQADQLRAERIKKATEKSARQDAELRKERLSQFLLKRATHDPITFALKCDDTPERARSRLGPANKELGCGSHRYIRHGRDWYLFNHHKYYSCRLPAAAVETCSSCYHHTAVRCRSR